MPELVVILVVALVVLGPKRLPEVARQLGKAMAEFRRSTTDVLEEFQQQDAVDDEDERRRTVRPPAVAPTPQPAAVGDKSSADKA